MFESFRFKNAALSRLTRVGSGEYKLVFFHFDNLIDNVAFLLSTNAVYPFIIRNLENTYLQVLGLSLQQQLLGINEAICSTFGSGGERLSHLKKAI
ncbi:hypothetical protein L596_021518 [Steinernema carpocapsae]|uniref:Uncharacterized protein n=1 Tax=Steinernema carpocapsae TaxID=34508 RepID=A0A4U5MJ12_STECR|nr:hypothetical protein L596_021518 [Steinernema carpocapsae]